MRMRAPAYPRGRRRPRLHASVCFNSELDAEDEDPFGRQEALQKDRQRQAARPPRLLQSHPGEKVAEAEAEDGEAGRHRPERPEESADPAWRRQVSRVKRSVHARKKRRKVLKEAKGY